ncbi:MAG: hypothetical protein H0T52_11505 [Lautropia sp.]|nr:hypothetical protein [Lautropia sp.]
MPERIGPKRVPPLHIDDFPVRDQHLLIAAARAWAKMAIIGFKDQKPFVVSVGHPEGLFAAEARPEELRAYSLARIRGLEAAADTDDNPPVAQRL